MITVAIISGLLGVWLLVGGAANLAAIPAAVCAITLLFRFAP